MLGVFTLAGYLGWQSGQSLRQEQVETQRVEAILTQLTRAREDIEAGNYRLAERRLEWVLEQAPTNNEATLLLAQIERAQEGPGTPTLPATETPPAPDTEPTTPSDDPAEAERTAGLRRLEGLVEDEAWEEAITAIIEFQAQYPEYEREETDRLLRDAYMGRGVEMLYGEQVELGLGYLSRAERLGTLPQDVRDQRLWAELYLDGIGFYGVNWDVALFYFRQLCAAAPFYQDACQLLYESLVAYGDQFAVQSDWCPAVSFYQEAAGVLGGQGVGGKLTNAREGCANATPTPEPTPPGGVITGTVPLTGTTPFTGTAPGE
jgi:hypothetical protein